VSEVEAKDLEREREIEERGIGEMGREKGERGY